MTDEEREEITRFAADQWTLILLDERLKDRPDDFDWCVRDLGHKH